MALNLKYGDTLDGKTVLEDDLVAINKGVKNSNASDAKRGSIYKGDKILGTTEADKLVTTEKMTVTGVTVGNFTNGFEIAEGTDVMTVLKQMLMKEIDVNKTSPTVTIKNNSSNAAGTYEVGTSVSVDLSHTYTDGKFTGQSGYSYNQSAGCAEGTTTYKKNGSNLAGNTDTVVLTEGNTDYSCTTTYGASTNVPVTNFGNNSSVSISAGSANSGNVRFTGVYKYFMGYSANTLVSQFDSASVRALTVKTGNITKDSTTTIVSNGTKIKSNGTSIVVACPYKYKLASVNSGLGPSIMSNFTETGTVEVTTGTTTTTYNVYIYPITTGSEVEFTNVTLSKA